MDILEITSFFNKNLKNCEIITNFVFGKDNQFSTDNWNYKFRNFTYSLTSNDIYVNFEVSGNLKLTNISELYPNEIKTTAIISVAIVKNGIVQDVQIGFLLSKNLYNYLVNTNVNLIPKIFSGKQFYELKLSQSQYMKFDMKMEISESELIRKQTLSEYYLVRKKLFAIEKLIVDPREIVDLYYLEELKNNWVVNKEYRFFYTDTDPVLEFEENELQNLMREIGSTCKTSNISIQDMKSEMITKSEILQGLLHKLNYSNK